MVRSQAKRRNGRYCTGCGASREADLAKLWVATFQPLVVAVEALPSGCLLEALPLSFQAVILQAQARLVTNESRSLSLCLAISAGLQNCL